MALSQQLILELLYKVSNTQELDKAKRDLESLGQKTDEVNTAQQGAAGSAFNFSASLSKLTTVAAAVATAVGVTAVAMDKFLDVAQEGAIISQTTDSFENFVDIVGAAPDVLEKLQAASRGTVADMKLMSSVMTLASGSSNELARELVNAAPQLMEIAKAASKLNPSVITTEQAFERLARGIKRSSPRILDDLGLLVKLGPAFEDWANQMDRSTQSMSAEEKQLAILNAVLGMHGDIVSQVGGDMESQVDAFAALETATTNLANAWKAKLAPAGIILANALTALLTGKGGLERISEEAFNASESFEEYTAAMMKAGYAVSPIAEANYELGKALEYAAQKEVEYYRALGLIPPATLTASNATAYWARDIDHLRVVAYGATQAVLALAAAEREAAVASAGLAAGLSGVLQNAGKTYQKTMQDTNATLGDTQSEYDKLHDAYIRNTMALHDSWIEVERADGSYRKQKMGMAMTREEAEKLWQTQGILQPQVQELIGQFDALGQAQADAAEAFKNTTNEMIYNAVAGSLSAGVSADLARSLGLLSEQDYAVGKATEGLVQQFTEYDKEGKIVSQNSGAIAAGTLQIADAVQKLHDLDIDVTGATLKGALEGAFDQEIITAPMEDRVGEAAENIQTYLNNAKDQIDKVELDPNIFEMDPEKITAATMEQVGGALEKSIELAIVSLDKKELDLGQVITIVGEDAVTEMIRNALLGGLTLPGAPSVTTPLTPPGIPPVPLPGREVIPTMGGETEGIKELSERLPELSSSFESIAESTRIIPENLERAGKALEEFGTTASPAIKQVDALDTSFKAFKLTVESAKKELEGVVRELAKIQSKTVTVTVKVKYQQGQTDAPGAQLGLDYIVPSGYSNDNYGPIFASSGERIQITPAVKVNSSHGEGRSVTMNVVQNIYDPNTSEMTMANLRDMYADMANERL